MTTDVTVRTYVEKEIGDRVHFLSLRPLKRGQKVNLIEYKKRKPYGVAKITSASPNKGQFVARRIE